MTALGNYYQTGIPDGWSPLGGQVVSMFGAGVNPGGSSTGSAVALAAGMAAATIGEETMGSIVSHSCLHPAPLLITTDLSGQFQWDMGHETHSGISQQQGSHTYQVRCWTPVLLLSAVV